MPRHAGLPALLGALVLASSLIAACRAKNDGASCHHLEFVMAAKSEVHRAKQSETSGQAWDPSNSETARAFVQSNNFLQCVLDVAGKVQGVAPPASLDRRAAGVLEWLRQLLQLPAFAYAVEGEAAFEPLVALCGAFQAAAGSEPYGFAAEALESAVKAFREAVVPAREGEAAAEEGSSIRGGGGGGEDGGRQEGSSISGARIRRAAAAARTSGSVLTDSSSSGGGDSGSVMQKQRLGAIQVGGQTADVQLEVVAAPTQVKPVIQVTRGGEALLKVGASGDMQLLGSLVVQGTQDALSSANSALASAGGLSVAKGAVIGGRVKVEATLDSGNGGSGAVQVEGGVSVGKRAFFGGSVSVGRPLADAGAAAPVGPRSLKVMSPDDEASVVVQTGAADKPAALELRGSPMGDGLPGEAVARISNINGSVVMDAGGGGVAVQGGGVHVRDEADVAIDHHSAAGSHASASLITRGGASVSKGLHVGADILVGSMLHARPAPPVTPGRAVRVHADAGPAELLLMPESKAPARVQLGRGGALEGRPGGHVELSAGSALDGPAGGVLLTAPGTEGVRLTHGRLGSGPGEPLLLEGDPGAQVVSRDGEASLQTRLPGQAVRLRPGGSAHGLELRAGAAPDAAIDISSSSGLSISAPGGGIDLLAGGGGDTGESIRLVANSTAADGVAVAAPNGGVHLLSGQAGLHMATSGDALMGLEGQASSFRVAAPPSPLCDAPSLLEVHSSGKVAVAGGVVAGTAQLKQGTAFVQTPAVTRNSVIVLTPLALRSPAAHHVVASKTPGLGFEVAAVDLEGIVAESDMSTLNWLMLDADPACHRADQ